MVLEFWELLLKIRIILKAKGINLHYPDHFLIELVSFAFWLSFGYCCLLVIPSLALEAYLPPVVYCHVAKCVTAQASIFPNPHCSCGLFW